MVRVCGQAAAPPGGTWINLNVREAPIITQPGHRCTDPRFLEELKDGSRPGVPAIGPTNFAVPGACNAPLEFGHFPAVGEAGVRSAAPGFQPGDHARSDLLCGMIVDHAKVPSGIVVGTFPVARYACLD